MIELLTIGAVTGLLSGFFGIGGGTILVPLLLLLGFDTKSAIGISVVQMTFGSIFGSYLNHKKGTLDVAMITIIGIGGFVGASLSGYITSLFSNRTLEIFFLLFATFALFRLFMPIKEDAVEKKISKVLLFIIGVFIGMMSITIGVGGSIMLVPILVGFLHVELKKAISAGLFFVVFSSIAGLISHTLEGHIDFKSGIIVGIASLLGVYAGIFFKDKVQTTLQKRLLVFFYIVIVIYLAKRVLIDG
ncbi:sulfite exporter TauE/SafE family protein [Sulfurimonas sp. C5]|uniref:sulfite exporter TauE/SafE family protein n=1 Tax=Sulfurimonas sp. C5 TaxID=3036947 RepID=UPI002456091A|nr:sulfite exporter TauE/SafE family protein [Sulfurimonas sp. C5]MDH4944029.1 sulfite exporter TauE/SafE family protein [Sulfurimonas sp. C5]